MDGSNYRNHPLFSDSSKVSAALELYYDDIGTINASLPSTHTLTTTIIEVVNPLGTKTGIHKLGVFYFTVKNLPSHLTSSMANIHVVAVAYTDDLKKHGYSSVLQVSTFVVVSKLCH